VPACAALAVCRSGGSHAAINWHDRSPAGWAIPAATDIAFAQRAVDARQPVAVSLKLFLTSLAIFDDIAAIV
jgi:NhaA family Na+:H+ antiporter